MKGILNDEECVVVRIAVVLGLQYWSLRSNVLHGYAC